MRRRSRSCGSHAVRLAACCMIILLGMLCGSGAATAAEKYLVLEKPLDFRVEESERVMLAITQGLLAAGCEVVVKKEGRGDACTTPACWRNVAAAANATDLLIVSGGHEEFGWRLSLEHRNAAGGIVERPSQVCHFCQVPAMAEWAQAAVKGTVNTARAERLAAIPAPKPAPPQPTTTAPAAAVSKPPLTTSTPASRSFRWVPWAVGATGALVLGYGAWALHKDGEKTGSCGLSSAGQKSCDEYDWKARGLGGVIGGGALLVTGVIWVLLTSFDSPPPVSVSATDVTLTVRF
jgi:hypothetical protein